MSHGTSVTLTIKEPVCEELLKAPQKKEKLKKKKKISPTLKSQHRPSFLHAKKPP